MMRRGCAPGKPTFFLQAYPFRNAVQEKRQTVLASINKNISQSINQSVGGIVDSVSSDGEFGLGFR